MNLEANITFVIDAKSSKDLYEKLRDLIDILEGPDDGLLIANSLRLTRRDMDELLRDYANIVHNGNYFATEKLIREIAGEPTLYDAPIDTWPKIAKAAQDAIHDKEFDDVFAEMAR
jgi:hypothetical protein